MTARKNGLPAGRHQEIGLELARMRDRLLTLSVEVANAYPDGSKAQRLASGVTGPVDRLRTELDNRWYSENPDATESPYYPAAGQRDSAGSH